MSDLRKVTWDQENLECFNNKSTILKILHTRSG
jgi:hypothetical protein